MKSMTCKQLGGACNKVFTAETFEEMADLSKQHGMEMYQQKDKAHLIAMEKIQVLMASPEKMKEWFTARKEEFNALPNL
ncbi:DUF1059 domain-containing protein [Flammeovirga pectinis]|uniref:DUF1059 domain-containing protein n=1 Tax=Flammeovirga pectinis TaxID=2494373 RepID=A0A3S9NYV8_9BACT|nr:DUF1059 domain-containing protein [Flammeovirga pectinis]AZQ61170.1 DUF1059 domain-containing protein [Flammeovirga pectinis]